LSKIVRKLKHKTARKSVGGLGDGAGAGGQCEPWDPQTLGTLVPVEEPSRALSCSQKPWRPGSGMKAKGQGASSSSPAGRGFPPASPASRVMPPPSTDRSALELAQELGPFGITVNSVAPGFMATSPDYERQWSWPAAFRDNFVNTIAMRRWARHRTSPMP
jgi:hypothetical protein